MPVEVHNDAIPQDLQETVVRFLNDFLQSATTGQKPVVGRTLLDPHKDNKWKRGRTRQALHFGAHVRGGKAIGVEVEDIPRCLTEVMQVLDDSELPTRKREHRSRSPSSQSPASSSPTQSPQPPPTPEQQQQQQQRHEARVRAVTVDFFRRGSYTPAIPATAPLAPPTTNAKYPTAFGGALPDTESEVYMLWLQADAEMVVGTARELAQCGTQGVFPPGAPDRTAKSEGEGEFYGMDRVVAPRGSAIRWDASRANGMQVAVPTCGRDCILVTFQTLTLEASTRVLANSERRAEERLKWNNARKAEREAKEAKGKGPIPGTPVAQSDLAAGEQCSTGTDGGGKTPSIEKEHVHAVYDTIAPHWSHTRYKPWPKVAEFLSELPPNSLVADAGCGNGKYLGCDEAGGCLLGSDTSINLLHVCRERLPQAEVFAADCMRLPYRSGTFDAAISIAVLHHFSTEARRIRALSELCRLLRPGGRALVYAWAIEQDQDSRRSFAQQDVLVPWHLADHHLPGGKNSSNGNDMDDENAAAGTGSEVARSEHPADRSGQSVELAEDSVEPAAKEPEHKSQGTGLSCASARAPAPMASSPPRHGVRLPPVAGAGNGGVVYQRYCHVYVEGELDELVRKVDGFQLVKSYYDRSNWCVLAERI